MKQFIFTYDTKNTDSKQLLELIIEFLVKRDVVRMTKPLGSTIIFYCPAEKTHMYWHAEIVADLSDHCYYVIAEIHYFPPSFRVEYTKKYEDDVNYDDSTETFDELASRIGRRVNKANI